MDPYEKDEVPMLLETHEQPLHDGGDSRGQRRTFSNKRASWSLSMDSFPSFERNNIGGFTGPLRSPKQSSFIEMSGPLYSSTAQDLYPVQAKTGGNMKEIPRENPPAYNGTNENIWARDSYGERDDNLLKSGQLGMCNDPYCTICPSDYRYKGAGLKPKRTNDKFDLKWDSYLYGDSKGWARTFCSFMYSCLPGIINPHNKYVQLWNQFFVISSLVSIFIDPLFFFVLSVSKDHACIVMDHNMAIIIVAFRSLTDFIYFLHIALQFRLAYVAPETTVVGAGDLVVYPKKIAMNYFKGYFFVDLFAVLPLPQIIVLLVLPNHLSSSGANYAKNLIRAAVLVQYIPRLCRFLPMLSGGSSIGFIFESASVNFVINLLTFILVGHIVGSFWYLFGLQRVNQCLREECKRIQNCKINEFMDCGWSNYDHSGEVGWTQWNKSANSACLIMDDAGGPINISFKYGIYQQVVSLTTEPNFITRYVYSLFWGFQQISTLAGNQVPSFFIWEVLFTMAIIGLGLLLFALLIGNMQNFLQSLGRRKLEMSLRRRDVEKWMTHRRLPDDLKRGVREAERYNWAATQGVNEETMMENLSEDLQRKIRQHLFSCLNRVHIFKMMEEPILDSIRERLRQKTYIKDSLILYPGGLIENVIFVVRGKMISIGEDGRDTELAVCGVELLIWILDNNSKANGDGKKSKSYGERPYSTKTVRCVTNVEAFILRAEDMEEVTKRFSRFLRNPRIQRAISYETPDLRWFSATFIQDVWRYRKKRLNRAKTGSQSRAE